ncbi:MAG: HAMP domain-containing protein [Dehalococcoidia bacterium]|nr:HAMP domain-containing protein [Dehalococcoidia bacterium]
MRPSIRLTLTLAFGALLTVVLGIFGVVMGNAVEGTLAREMDRRLVVRASEIRLALWPGGQPADAEVFKRSDLDFSETKLIARLAFVQLVDTMGRVLAASDSLEPLGTPLAPPPAGPVAEDTAPWFTDTTVLDGIPLRVLTVPLFSGRSMVGRLLVGQDRRSLQEERARLASLLAILWATALGGGSLLAWITTRQGLAPLTAMARHAQRIAGGRLFHERIAGADRTDEVGWLVEVINQLLATVENTLDQHRQFVADTSHELRNPLLTIQTNLDLLDRIDDPAERAECLRETRAEVQRMSRLVIDLLLLARGEERLILERTTVLLRELVYQAARIAQRHTNGQHIEVFALPRSRSWPMRAAFTRSLATSSTTRSGTPRPAAPCAWN